jgi:exodeoxyribonuclease V alpha subunit
MSPSAEPAVPSSGLAVAPAVDDAIAGNFDPLDVHFADFLVRRNGADSPPLRLAALLVSRAGRAGHICLNLADMAGRPVVPADSGGEGGPWAASQSVPVRARPTGNPMETNIPPTAPDLEAWRETLLNTAVVGRPGDFRPLILDEQNRLYLHRYHEYEQTLAEEIRRRLAEPPQVDRGNLAEGLRALFPAEDAGDPAETNWPQVAAAAALTRRFCVISGGPGTGKTTTVARILALLLQQHGPDFRVALAAPTGKAAARLSEAIRQQREKLPKSVRDAVTGAAVTLHRLLGWLPGPGRFRRGPENPIPAEAVVVDEASMVDLALMSRLASALRPDARLILLGDRDQLASVEAGAVLGDICDTGTVHRFSKKFCEALSDLTGAPPSCDFAQAETADLADGIVELQRSYRFKESSGIRAVSRAVNAGDGDAALRRARSGEFDDIGWRPLPARAELEAALTEPVRRTFGAYLKQLGEPEAAFSAFNGFRLLCAVRSGPFGVENVNRLAERILRRAGMIKGGGEWYPGRPVMVTRNDYSLRLFNGDVGLVLPDDKGGTAVFFPEESGGLRRVAPLRLPAHETVFAMTVHKSQGSEFDRLLLLLPDADAAVLTRELVYTGLTRAIHRADLWAAPRILRAAVERPIRRTSGLRDALWGRAGAS